MVEETLKSEAPKEDFSRRVFDLVNRYGGPALDKNEWRGIREDIWKIGIPGVQGFIKAMEMPHSPTRRVVVANATPDDAAQSDTDANAEEPAPAE